MIGEEKKDKWVSLWFCTEFVGIALLLYITIVLLVACELAEWMKFLIYLIPSIGLLSLVIFFAKKIMDEFNEWFLYLIDGVLIIGYFLLILIIRSVNDGNVILYSIIGYTISTYLALLLLLKNVKEMIRKDNDINKWDVNHKLKKAKLISEWLGTVFLVFVVAFFKLDDFNDFSLNILTDKGVISVLCMWMIGLFTEQSLFMEYIKSIMQSEFEKRELNKKIDKFYSMLSKNDIKDYMSFKLELSETVMK